MQKTMRYLRFHLLAALLTLACCVAGAANILRVDSVKYPAGKPVVLPILLENSSDIAGVQFDLSVPYELAVDTNGVVDVQLSRTRLASHRVVTRKLGTEWRNSSTHAGISTYHKYRFIIYSDENALVLDRKGTLLTVSLTTSGELDNGAVLPVYLLDNTVVLSDREKQNVLTSKENGKITIEEIPRPDLLPADITVEETTVDPSGKIHVNWHVKNIGQAPTADGWSEQIALVTVAGNITKSIATCYYEETLAAGATVSRQAEIDVPALLGLDGVTKVQVTVVPNEKTGEHPSLRDNNTAKSDKNFTVSKKLTLELQPLRINEAYSSRVMAKLSRSGRWNNIRSFKITATEDARLTVPSSVTIPANQSGTVFYLNFENNNVVDADSIVKISVEGDGYEAVEETVIIEDDEFPELKVVASKTVLTEGESFDLTITTPRVSEYPINLSIVSEDNKRFQFPKQAVIPAGESSVTVTVKTVDDELPNLEQTNLFTVSADRCTKGTAEVILQDNDMPMLTLTLTPDKVSESAGVTAVTAVLTRTGKIDNKITIRLSDDSDGALYYSNRSLEMPKGTETIYFNLGPVDNTLQDGDRVYTLSAGIWVSSCSCAASGESAGSVTAKLTVLDDDGAALTVSSQAATVKEGEETVLTVGRNTLTDLSQSLTVNLSSNYDADLEYEKTVVIPAGKASVDVAVKSKKNEVSGDSHTVIFTVAAEGYSSGTCFLLVTDQTLPDARIAKIEASATEAVISSRLTLSVTVVNDGAYPLPANTSVVFYQKDKNNAIATAYTTKDIPVGGSEVLTRAITLPDKVQECVYYATVNGSRTVGELIYTNNTSEELTVKVTSPFTATVKTDKQVYRQGEKVVISGQMHGSGTANSQIDVYMLNDGAREVKKATTDDDGRFTLEWQLYPLQSGHFAVGACYTDDPTVEEMASFDVYGLKRAENSYITCEVTCGEPYTGVVKLQNAGKLSLSGLKTEIVGAPDGCDAQFSLPATAAADETISMTYALNGSQPTPGSDWQLLKVRITSDEGAFLEVTIHYYARLAQGNLVAENQNIVTTMNKDNGRDYSFYITNTGKGNTGTISLALPDWMKSLTPMTMPGLNQNDTTTVVLRLMPNSDMQLNVPVTGRIGINCENGNGTYVNYSVTPVSDLQGTITIDVTDEYTYYTEEKPHVSGAEIVLRNPVTGALVAQGVSDENGLFSITLPEGYYQLNVTADKHTSYKNNVLVDPGVNILHVVSLSYQTISVSWTVEETEVEDEYSIVTTLQYETNVPAPVVELNQPDKIEIMQLGVGESIIFYAILTNKGLIAAQNTSYYVPEWVEGFKFETLVEKSGFTLAPQQSYVIPVKVTRMENAELSRVKRASSSNGCHLETGVGWEVKCGDDYQKHSYPKTITYKVCDGGIYEAIVAAGGGLGGPTMYGGGGGYGATSSSGSVSTSSGCNECLKDISHQITLAGDLLDCGAMKFTPFVGCVYGIGRAVQGALNNWYEGTTSDWVMWWLGTINTGVSCIFPAAGPVCGIIGCGLGLLDIANGCGGHVFFSREAGGPFKDYAGSVAEPYVPSWVDVFKQRTACVRDYLNASKRYIDETYGNPKWGEVVSVEESQDLLDVLETTVANGGELSAQALHVYKPMNITEEEFESFIERVNNSLLYAGTDAEEANMINVDTLYTCLNTMLKADSIAKTYGYEDVGDLFKKEMATIVEKVQKENSSVCATISLQIEQTMTMTRQAFRGTLTVTNGNPERPMTDVKLMLNVTNKKTGQVATAREFEMHTETLKMFQGDLDMESGWYLGADSTGTATILFIPSKFAAPEEPVDYAFGGTLNYVDPNTGMQVTRELYPVTLTVKPSPELDLTYFMQRDIYGDDPLTGDVVEPMTPGEFAVIINNKGYGDATNVRMVTKQPQIIDNQKGIYIDFEFLSSQLNGQEKTLAMGESIPTEFGTIPAHSQAYAQWWLQSTLLGHFVDYDIKATHVTSYGNENLSLLDQVTIHELIHGFTPSGSSAGRAFLVNDVVDSDDLPDQIYFTDATQQDVYMSAGAVATKVSDTEYTLTVTPSVAGWNYGSVFDPTVGRQNLISVVRQRDNAVINVDNIWQTDRDLIDGQEWDYVYRLHFVGEMPIEGETYLLTFEEKPEVELQVESFEGVPASGTLQTAPLTELTVNFNKAVAEDGFTTKALTLTCQGEKVDVSTISIEKLSDTSFKLGLGELTQADGYYVLTVQTADITDAEGFSGAVGKQATWVQFFEGKVSLTLQAQPAEGGTVAPASGMFAYNEPVTLTATPVAGYEFVQWLKGETIVSKDAEYVYTPTDHATLTAVFSPKYYEVTVSYDENAGSVEGGGTGRYTYGTTLNLTATAADGYQFDGWKVNGSSKGTSAQLTWNVESDVTIEAVFTEQLTATLVGRVTSSSDDTPIIGAVVTLTHESTVYTATTDALGRYTINVEDKKLTYDLSCKADGYIWSANSSFWFTVAGKQTKDFVLLPGATVVLPDDGICTFSATVPLEFKTNADVEAYYASEFDAEGLVIRPVNSAPAGQGLVLKGNAGRRVDMKRATGDTDHLTGNLLTGTAYAPYTVAADDVYVLENRNGEAKFYAAARGLVVPQYKAYCLLPQATGDVTIIWSEASLVNMVKATLENNDKHFGTDGRRIHSKEKGVHVVQGKKFVVK